MTERKLIDRRSIAKQFVRLQAPLLVEESAHVCKQAWGAVLGSPERKGDDAILPMEA